MTETTTYTETIIEHPIIFSRPMVQAILRGEKTQTRRIMKRQPLIDLQSGDILHIRNEIKIGNKVLSEYREEVQPIDEWKKSQLEYGRCPYGKPGHHLWVREAFTIIGGKDIRGPEPDFELLDYEPEYVFRGQKQPHIEKLYKWKPSIHMPRAACRIILEIENIRAERLQDITEEDAIKEGVIKYEDGAFAGYEYIAEQERTKDGYMGDDWGVTTAKESFKQLWGVINGKKSWEANPFVWVVDFQRIK